MIHHLHCCLLGPSLGFVAIQEHPAMELMTIKMTPSIVPDAMCFNPVLPDLPIDGNSFAMVWLKIIIVLIRIINEYNFWVCFL
jgi:hypothetical protein